MHVYSTLDQHNQASTKETEPYTVERWRDRCCLIFSYYCIHVLIAQNAWEKGAFFFFSLDGYVITFQDNLYYLFLMAVF